MKIIKFILVGIVCVIQIQVFAQQTAAVSENNFSLQQCIEYAVSNHISIKSATLDQQISVAKVGEIRAASLPQASIDALMMNNIEVQSMFARASALDKNAPSNVIVPLAFGVPYSSSATLGVTQIIFNGTLLVGLQAAKTYTELTKKAIDINKNSIIQNVSKAYYLTLINEERKQLFASNLRRMDTLLKQYPEVTEIEMWDDRIAHISRFQEWGDKQIASGRLNKFKINVVPTTHHGE